MVFAKRPTDNVIPGETFHAETGPAPTEADLKDGEVLFQTHYLSLDPSMRIWLNGAYKSSLKKGGDTSSLISVQTPHHTCHQCRSERSCVV